jgi:outer membrane protein assembly factor BamB/predicted phosphohydrolase
LILLGVAALILVGDVSSAGRPLRFAWLSDTHVGDPTGELDLRLAVQDILRQASLDFVLLSGDITEFGSNDQLRTAKRILDSLTVPYFIIPGNHDTKWSESGGTMFSRLWGSERFCMKKGDCWFIGLHQGPRMRMGDGHLGPEDLRWLDSTFAAVPDTTAPIFVVTHYPVDSSISNWREILSRLRRRNTLAVLCGHGHANKALDFYGVPGVMGRSSLRSGNVAGGYTIVSIQADTASFLERRTDGTEEGPWYTLSLQGARERRQPPLPQPDYSTNERFTRVKESWKFATGYTIGSKPFCDGGRIVIGDASGTVYCLSASDGALLWKRVTGGPIYSSPDGAGGRVVVGSADGFIYCMTISSGEILWKYQTAAPVVACPAISGPTVFIGSSDHCFRAISMDDGSLRWQYSDVRGFVESRPLLTAGEVVFGAWDGSMYSLDSATGVLRWKWDRGTPGVLFSPAACWPVASHGKVFFVAPDRATTALSAKDGSTKWRSTRFQVRETIGASEDSSRIYFRLLRDSLVAISGSADSLRTIWMTRVGFGYDINSAMIVENRGIVYYGTKNGFVMALRGDTGEFLWEHRISTDLVNTVCPTGDGGVIAADVNGVVRMLRVTE